MRPLTAGLAVLFLLVQPGPAAAQLRGEDLTVSVVTFGPHEHPFFKFGHNAVLVEHSSGQGFVYNFGMFDFSSPALIPKFALGRSMYWLARTPRDATFAAYIEENRTVQVQELDLTPEQRKTVFERLEDNARPLNRYYLYDYFFDNCSTRVRDVVDRAVGGRLRLAAAAPARLTFRGHGLRLTADLTWEYLALAFGLGTTADRPITRFEEGFIPMELHDLLRDVKLPSADGSLHPLVKAERTVFRASRVDPPLNPPNRTGWFALVGIALGGLLALLGWLAQRRRWARITGATVLGLVGGITGLLGLLLVFLWVATNHRAAHANANILQAVPIALAFPFLAPGVGRGRVRALQRAWFLAAAAAALSILGLLLHLVGLIGQQNLSFIALFLPLWLGAAAGLHFIYKYKRPVEAAGAAGSSR